MTKISISAALSLLLLAAGCKGGDDSFRATSQGAAYEIVVVADRDVWDGPAGDTLRAMFYKRFPMVNRQETTFNVLRVHPSGFKKLVPRHRNILVADIDPGHTSPELKLGHDTYARPQIVLGAYAPDAASMTELISTHRDDIMLLLENAEKDRDVDAAMRHTPPEIGKLIRDKFGFDLSMGPGYTVRSESDDFLWLDYRMPTADQGIVIYTYPFSGVKDFDREELLKRRNEFVANIPGDKPGSYMGTNPEIIDLIYKKIGGRPWAEMQGFWRVEGDFMGGPYRNFSTFDAANRRVIAIDFYVYAPDPRLFQRNFIKQLEHFIYTVKIEGETPSWDSVGSSPETK